MKSVITSFVCIYTSDIIYTLSIHRMSSRGGHSVQKKINQDVKHHLEAAVHRIKRSKMKNNFCWLFLFFLMALATVSHFRFFKIQGGSSVKT